MTRGQFYHITRRTFGRSVMLDEWSGRPNLRRGLVKWDNWGFLLNNQEGKFCQTGSVYIPVAGVVRSW